MAFWFPPLRTLLARSSRQRQPHVCLAGLPLQTSEHLAAIADQCSALGIDACWLLLDSPDALDSRSSRHTVGVLDTAPITAVGDAATLEAHFAAARPDAIFLQSPYPEHYPQWFWDSAWSGRTSFAGYGATLSTWESGLYELPVLRNCAWLLAESEFNRSKYLHHGNDETRVVLTGNPLMFELRARLATPPVMSAARPTTLLWAPHWTETWFENPRGFSRWRETVVPLLDFAAKHPQVSVVVRPHPLLLDRFLEITADPVSLRDDADLALSRLLSLANVSISDRSFLDDVIESDALLTEGVSIIAYFAATGKPMGIVRDADSPPFNDVGEALCAASDLLADSAAIAAWLSTGVANSFSGDSANRQAVSAGVHPTWAESPIAIWAGVAGLVRS